ncbi:uncharacterized protein LDX57_012570 [Aspergillus melleus]|uniref:uncharacterized protein n=1 Tax=Aspergillus melleus TaxID=138277 RepID=UPI001E8DBA24|nr:uncharacterized protein LDX57_012570 [Aspergillus melleus]KAH8434938.1 hypothetical protein LDX57_012570 [Aspergillus melleus]
MVHWGFCSSQRISSRLFDDADTRSSACQRTHAENAPYVLEWNNARKAIPQVAGEFQNVLQPHINAAVDEEMKNLDDTSDTTAAAAVKVITEGRVLADAAARLLQDVLGQTTSRLLFSGHIRHSRTSYARGCSLTGSVAE